MKSQKTISRTVAFQGLGVHSGINCSLTFHPAPEHTGVRFRRIDLHPALDIVPTIEHTVVEESYRRTTLEKGEVKIYTAEHILATLLALEIDNLLIELDAEEPPFLDGSALPYAQALLDAGLIEQDAPRSLVSVEHPYTFKDGEAELTVLPNDQLMVTFFIDFPETAIGQQAYSLMVTPQSFLEEIAPARTFCLEHDVEHLRELGLIKGGSLECALVVGKQEYLNPPLRFPEEPVRHKILDFLGDLFLINCFPVAHFTVNRSGHLQNVKFLRELKELFPCPK